MRRRLLLALGCVSSLAAGLFATPVAPAATKLYAPSDATMPSRPFAAPLHDAVLRRDGAAGQPARSPVAHASALQRFYSTDGQGPISVAISRSYGQVTRELAQPYVDFLASRAHGAELEWLTLLVVTPAELPRDCAPQALACYIPAQEMMIVPGEQTPAGEVPLEYVITHEYGHHVAANRDNDPWPAIGPPSSHQGSASSCRPGHSGSTGAPPHRRTPPAGSPTPWGPRDLRAAAVPQPVPLGVRPLPASGRAQLRSRPA